MPPGFDKIIVFMSEIGCKIACKWKVLSRFVSFETEFCFFKEIEIEVTDNVWIRVESFFAKFYHPGRDSFHQPGKISGVPVFVREFFERIGISEKVLFLHCIIHDDKDISNTKNVSLINEHLFLN